MGGVHHLAADALGCSATAGRETLQREGLRQGHTVTHVNMPGGFYIELPESKVARGENTG